MGREVRKVPANWEHPKDHRGEYISLKGGSVSQKQAEWDEGERQWNRGFVEDFSGNGWRPSLKTIGCYEEEWGGQRPVTEDYMPDWPESERTHFQMYENTSEGTPISPVFTTAEELAHWLADTGASAFAEMTASYEYWLATIQSTSGSAPSMMVTDGILKSGVEAIGKLYGRLH